MCSTVASLLASTIRSFDDFIKNNDEISQSNEAICDIYHLPRVEFTSIPNEVVCCLNDKGLITSIDDERFTLIYNLKALKVDLIDLPEYKVREICVSYN